MNRWTTLAVVAALAVSTSAWAVAPENTTGVSGLGVTTTKVATGAGRNADDGLSKPSLHVNDFRGSVGIVAAGAHGLPGFSTENGFHASGMGKVVTAGIGRTTMETVPGRSPTYITVVAGKRVEPLVGTRGPEVGVNH